MSPGFLKDGTKLFEALKSVAFRFHRIQIYHFGAVIDKGYKVGVSLLGFLFKGTYI
jgi:hypothetical protein